MLNKKALRKFAGDNPAPAISPRHGLLHAPQIGYIIRTGIKIISGRRTLIFYKREQAAGGIQVPIWTMFQSGGDYITLARRPDGTTCWRAAAFERLGDDYHFTGECAFYSARDERRVCDFLQAHDHGGIAALVRAQKAIQDNRSQERQLKKDKKPLLRMELLKTLPHGLKPRIRREAMPAYFRCEHTSAKKPVTEICTSCGKESTTAKTSRLRTAGAYTSATCGTLSGVRLGNTALSTCFTCTTTSGPSGA